MELFQTVTPCPKCGTRLTVSERRDPGSDGPTSYEVSCPVCRTGVTIASRGTRGCGTPTLICFERTAMAGSEHAP